MSDTTIDPRITALEPLVGQLFSFYQRVGKLVTDDLLWLRARQLSNFASMDWPLSDDVRHLIVSVLGSTWLTLYRLRRLALTPELDKARVELMHATCYTRMAVAA